jgi:pimeloyl-ACP methyl ester carboxylesterase
MPEFIRWNSQSLDSWAKRHAQGKFIDLDGHQTHYIEKGEGEPIILLHGFLYDSYLWAANIDELARHFKVYALDLWGWGYSTRAALDYGYQLYASQVLLFMDTLGIRRASLVGQSMGSGTAMLFCVEHRLRVNKLLLVAAAGLPNRLPLVGKIFNLPGIGEFLLGWNTDVVRKAGLKDYFIHNKELVTKSYFENVTRPHKISNSKEIYLAIQRKQFFDKLSAEIEQLAKMEVPILLIWGRDDKALSLRRGEELHRILKGSRLEVLDKAGHVPNFECAERFNQLALDFLQSR